MYQLFSNNYHLQTSAYPAGNVILLFILYIMNCGSQIKTYIIRNNSI